MQRNNSVTLQNEHIFIYFFYKFKVDSFSFEDSYDLHKVDKESGFC